MAHPGHNGQRGDNGADASQYVFNPMAYNYHQNQNLSEPTILSQQEANVMANFFDNPDTAHADQSFLAFGYDDTDNMNVTDLASNSVHDQTSATFNGSMSRPAQAFASYEFSDMFGPQQPNQSAGDAAASTLVALSTSNDQSNLLNASNYMTWGQLVGAQAVQQSPARQGLAPPMRAQPVKANSTSQLQNQVQMPQGNSWADIQNQAFQQQRTRHASLQLDTTNTHLPSHQQGWQNGPQSAYPHAVSKSRPPLAKFGSDSHFSPHGYTSQHNMSQEDKQGNLLQLAMAGSPQPANNHRHSVAGVMPIAHSTQSSPATMGANSAPPYPIDPAFGAQYKPNLKRKASHVDDNLTMSAPTPIIKHSDSFETPLLPQHHKDQNDHDVYAQQAVLPDRSAAHEDAPQAGNGTRSRKAARIEKPQKRNLTEYQKRANHIQSEQKRRDAMKGNYTKLGKLVIGLSTSGSGSSRSEMLITTAEYMEATIRGNRAVAAILSISLDEIDAEITAEGGDNDDAADDGDDNAVE